MRMGPVRLAESRAAQLPLLDLGTDHPLLDSRARGTQFLELAVRTVVNAPTTTKMSFWSLNPYVGCEFGCAYCYARDTHRWLEDRFTATLPEEATRYDNPSDAFERHIYVKRNAPGVLLKTLDPLRLGDHTLVIGTATDPYQPAERRFRLTRQLLEALLHFKDLSLSLITKSTLIGRDAALLAELSRRHRVTVNISLITTDAALARRIEPRTPVPAARLRALRSLTERGVDAGLMVAPILPGLTDGRHHLARLAQAGKEAGARFLHGAALRLKPTAKARFLSVLGREFPELLAAYQQHYAGRINPTSTYEEALNQRLQSIQRQFGYRTNHDFSSGSREQRSASRSLHTATPALL
jgi:DNA repair photolyase